MSVHSRNLFRGRRSDDEIPRVHDHIRAFARQGCSHLRNAKRSPAPFADVQIRCLSNAETDEGGRKVRDMDRDTAHVQPGSEKRYILNGTGQGQ
jgi:hypothetical protein